ncbi:MAG: acyl-ACP--UDP-N-acetylglucosamine O-acyltransferase [Betaproteobacteria bacterium]|nr:acyl-ACP--UDP-N-acetylglucosamine O-acyltransferase [Betaproteobacteria bacterium]
MADIHPSAVVAESARLADDVVVGPQAVIGAEVTLGHGCLVGSACLIEGPSEFGADNVFYGHCSVGSASQDKKYRQRGLLRVGAGNVFREFTTINRGTGAEDETVIGNGNLFLAYVHVAHDCLIADNCVFANCVQLGGHVQVGARATLGGMAAVHQHCRIGSLAMIGAGTIVRTDVPPYAKCTVAMAGQSVSVNDIGMRRAGMDDAQIGAVRSAWRLLYRQNLTLDAATDQIGKLADDCECLQVLAGFLAKIKEQGRGIVRPRRGNSGKAKDKP